MYIYHTNVTIVTHEYTCTYIYHADVTVVNIIYVLLHSSVGRYQHFTSGIQYYKFRTVFGITRYFDQAQLTSYT